MCPALALAVSWRLPESEDRPATVLHIDIEVAPIPLAEAHQPMA